jgi:integrase
MLRTIMNYAIRKLDADIHINPATAIEYFPQRNKQDLLALSDLPVWWAAVERIGNPSHRAYFRLLLFTGLRRMDAASIKLADIHEDCVHRPCPKGGTKRAFDVAMTPQLRTIIDEAKTARILHPRSEYLFPANGKVGHFRGQWHDQPLDISPHALRRTYASACIAAGLDLVHTKALLNHTGGGDVTLTSYIKLSLTQKTQAAVKVANYISAHVTSPTAITSDEAKPLISQDVAAEDEAIA